MLDAIGARYVNTADRPIESAAHEFGPTSSSKDRIVSRRLRQHARARKERRVGAVKHHRWGPRLGSTGRSHQPGVRAWQMARFKIYCEVS
jgi:hypothetical protein